MIKSLAKIFISTMVLIQIFSINAFAGNNEVVAARIQDAIDSTTGPAFAIKTDEESSLSGTKSGLGDKGDVLQAESKVRTVKVGDKIYRVSAELGQYKTTAYTPEEKGNNITATGVKPSLNHTVSADWSYIPAGTKILIGESDIVYTVEDTGVKGKVVDIFLATNKEAKVYGVQYKDIFILEEVK